jgi:hypothetical protein
MRLTSIPSGGYLGLVDIGTVGITPDDPLAPGFLGLPLTCDAVYLRAGAPVDPAFEILRQDGWQSVFHTSPGLDDSGTYDVMPEPAELLLVGGGLIVPSAIGHRRQGRPGGQPH